MAQGKGYVAFLDVLGFSALLTGGEGEGGRLQEYLRCIQEALATNERSPKVEYVVFSDSIILTTPDAYIESLLELLLRCSRLFGLMLNTGIPLRGAIAYGAFSREAMAESVFVAGRPIIEAYRFESEQDWVGIMLAPSVVRQVPDLLGRCSTANLSPSDPGMFEGILKLLPWAAFVQPNPQIPFHMTSLERNDFDGFAIVPSDGTATPDALVASLGTSLEALLRMKSLAPDPRSQAKYARSYQWLHNIRGRWVEVVFWQDRYAREQKLVGGASN